MNVPAVDREGQEIVHTVISVIQHKIADIYRDIVLPVVTARTGLTAFNIHGTTIHRLLSLPEKHGKPADYYRLQ